MQNMEFGFGRALVRFGRCTVAGACVGPVLVYAFLVATRDPQSGSFFWFPEFCALFGVLFGGAAGALCGWLSLIFSFNKEAKKRSRLSPPSGATGDDRTGPAVNIHARLILLPAIRQLLKGHLQGNWTSLDFGGQLTACRVLDGGGLTSDTVGEDRVVRLWLPYTTKVHAGLAAGSRIGLHVGRIRVAEGVVEQCPAP